jgi:hypothetical protein
MSNRITADSRNPESWHGAQQPAGSETIGDLFSDLIYDFSTLLGQELRLARSEIQEKAGQMAQGLVGVILGLCLAIAGLVTLMGGMAIGYGTFLPFWFACFLVGLLFIIFGLMAIYVGRRFLEILSLTPKKTAASLGTDLALIQEKAVGVAAQAPEAAIEQVQG